MDSGIFFPIFLLALAGMALWLRHQWIVSQRQLWEHFAQHEHMEFSDAHFPVALSGDLLDAMPFFFRSRFCVYGKRHGEEVFVMQIARGWGNRGGNWTTVLGCKQRFPARYHPKRRLVWRLGRGSGWVVISSSWWMAVTLNRGQVLDAWNALRTTTEPEAKHLDAEVEEGIVIRPRHQRPTDI